MSLVLQLVLTVFSPLLIALLSRASDRLNCWPEAKALIAPVVIALIWFFVPVLVNEPFWPITIDRWASLAALYGIQQLVYNGGEASKIIPSIEGTVGPDHTLPELADQPMETTTRSYHSSLISQLADPFQPMLPDGEKIMIDPESDTTNQFDAKTLARNAERLRPQHYDVPDPLRFVEQPDPKHYDPDTLLQEAVARYNYYNDPQMGVEYVTEPPDGLAGVPEIEEMDRVATLRPVDASNPYPPIEQAPASAIQDDEDRSQAEPLEHKAKVYDPTDL